MHLTWKHFLCLSELKSIVTSCFIVWICYNLHRNFKFLNVFSLFFFCLFVCLFVFAVKLYRGSSHCGSMVMNPTSIHEDLGSIPGLAQSVKDLALL